MWLRFGRRHIRIFLLGSWMTAVCGHFAGPSFPELRTRFSALKRDTKLRFKDCRLPRVLVISRVLDPMNKCAGSNAGWSMALTEIVK